MKDLFKIEKNKTDLIDNLNSIEDIQKISSIDLEFLCKKIIKRMYEMNIEELDDIDNELFKINYYIDKFYYDNEDVMNKYYSICSMRLMSNVFHSLYNEKKFEKTMDVIFENEYNRTVIEAIAENKIISHNALAKKIGKTPQNLTNYFSKNKTNNIIITSKLSGNDKNKYYSLSFDAMQYYKGRVKGKSSKRVLDTEYKVLENNSRKEIFIENYEMNIYGGK